MDRLDVRTNPVRRGLAGLAGVLCGFSHGKTTFPITLQARTCVACLECGRHLPHPEMAN